MPARASMPRRTAAATGRAGASPCTRAPFSQDRGTCYGTILVDADQRRPIEVLPDRTAPTLAAWLAAHAGIEILTRDRSGAYGDAAARGAPGAVQVADRFHLVADVGKALEQVLDDHRSVLRELALPVPAEAVRPTPEGSSSEPSPPTWSIAPHLTRLQHLQQGRRARRRERYERLRALHERGWPVPAIAQLGPDRLAFADLITW